MQFEITINHQKSDSKCNLKFPRIIKKRFKVQLKLSQIIRNRFKIQLQIMMYNQKPIIRGTFKKF